MNAIMNTFEQRLLNLEIVLQANNQIANRSHTIIDHNLLDSDTNKIDTLSERNSLISNQQSLTLTLDKQFHNLNLSPYVSFDDTTIDHIDPSTNSLHSGL